MIAIIAIALTAVAGNKGTMACTSPCKEVFVMHGDVP